MRSPQIFHRFLPALATAFALVCAAATPAQEKISWKPLPFAIVRYNDDAPRTWNLYHSDKHGVLLLHIWKRYLLIAVAEEEVYDIDPQKVILKGENAELDVADVPDDPIEVTEWKVRDAGPVQRVRFRFGKNGNSLEIQIPLKPDGKPAY